jgi:hypothetical protein
VDVSKAGCTAEGKVIGLGKVITSNLPSEMRLDEISDVFAAVAPELIVVPPVWGTS